MGAMGYCWQIDSAPAACDFTGDGRFNLTGCRVHNEHSNREHFDLEYVDRWQAEPVPFRLKPTVARVSASPINSCEHETSLTLNGSDDCSKIKGTNISNLLLHGLHQNHLRHLFGKLIITRNICSIHADNDVSYSDLEVYLIHQHEPCSFSNSLYPPDSLDNMVRHAPVL
jgi:hypothetical protein